MASFDTSRDSQIMCTVVSLDAGPRRPFAVLYSEGVVAIRHWCVTEELGGHWSDVLIEINELRKLLIT